MRFFWVAGIAAFGGNTGNLFGLQLPIGTGEARRSYKMHNWAGANIVEIRDGAAFV